MNQYWCGDITYIRTNLGWVYLAVANRGTQYSSLGYMSPVAYRLQKDLY